MKMSHNFYYKNENKTQVLWEGSKRDFNNFNNRSVSLLNFYSSVLSCDKYINNLNGGAMKFMVRNHKCFSRGPCLNRQIYLYFSIIKEIVKLDAMNIKSEFNAIFSG